MNLVIPALILGSAILASVILLVRRSKPDSSASTTVLLQSQIAASQEFAQRRMDALQTGIAESLQNLSTQMAQSMTATHEAVGARLDSTTKVIGDVREQLGELRQSAQRMIQLGEDVGKLEDVLRAPKLRGTLGELFLGDLLAQILPASHYETQYKFRWGATVDAIIKLRSGIVPIDAKFPLENFRRILSAANEVETAAARKVFIRDVREHIDAIASKYIRVDENTFDFALMYIPAENVYYETIIKDESSEDGMALFNYALKKRVIPVSPNSFYAYLQTILLGLKGMRVEEHSREIITALSRLQKDFEGFSDPFRLVGNHLENSVKKFQEARKQLDRLEASIGQADGLAKGLANPDAPLLENSPTTVPVTSLPSDGQIV